MKSKLLHEHSMAEYLYTRPELLEWKKPWTNEEEFEGRGWFQSVAAVWRSIHKEREEYSDTLIKKLEEDPMWAEVLLLIREVANPGSRDLGQVPGHWKEKVALDATGQMPGTSVKDIFKEYGVEWSSGWADVVQFVGLSDDTNSAEGPKERMAQLAPWIGATGGVGAIATGVAGIPGLAGILGLAATGAVAGTLFPLLALVGAAAIPVKLILDKLDEWEELAVIEDIEASGFDEDVVGARDLMATGYRNAFWKIELQLMKELVKNPRTLPSLDPQQAFADALGDLEVGSAKYAKSQTANARKSRERYKNRGRGK